MLGMSKGLSITLNGVNENAWGVFPMAPNLKIGLCLPFRLGALKFCRYQLPYSNP